MRHPVSHRERVAVGGIPLGGINRSPVEVAHRQLLITSFGQHFQVLRHPLGTRFRARAMPKTAHLHRILRGVWRVPAYQMGWDRCDPVPYPIALNAAMHYYYGATIRAWPTSMT